MTLEELKAQRAKLDKQIREYQNAPLAKTERFQVVEKRKGWYILKYAMASDVQAKAILHIASEDKKDAKSALNFMCDSIDNLIAQLESIKASLKNKT